MEQELQDQIFNNMRDEFLAGNFTHGGIKLSTGELWEIAHNLQPPTKLMVAFQSWASRTDEVSLDSFCHYIVDKDPLNTFAMSLELFNQIMGIK